MSTHPVGWEPEPLYPHTDESLGLLAHATVLEPRARYRQWTSRASINMYKCIGLASLTRPRNVGASTGGNKPNHILKIKFMKLFNLSEDHSGFGSTLNSSNINSFFKYFFFFLKKDRDDVYWCVSSSTQEAKEVDWHDFNLNLSYKVSSRRVPGVKKETCFKTGKKIQTNQINRCMVSIDCENSCNRFPLKMFHF